MNILLDRTEFLVSGTKTEPVLNFLSRHEYLRECDCKINQIQMLNEDGRVKKIDEFLNH